MAFGLIGFFFARTFLKWMQTPESLIGMASLYVRIYSVGIPFSIVYNFGAAILRSVGDTTRPLIFLVIAGVVNIVFNLGFVFLLGMDVDGVATATVISQLLSAVLVVAYMMKIKTPYGFSLKKMRIYSDKLLQILAVGLPAGIQGALFSISNVIIQMSINGFGNTVIKGNTASSNIEGYVHICMNAFHQAALNFTGQHIGAKKYSRIKKITGLCVVCVTVVGFGLGLAAICLGTPLLNLYSPGETDAIAVGLVRLKIICYTYFIYGLTDVLSGVLRGMGYSFSTMVVTLACVCGLRLVWIYTVFAIPAYHTLEVLLYSYPISWITCLVIQLGLFAFAYFRMMKRAKRDGDLTPQVPSARAARRAAKKQEVA